MVSSKDSEQDEYIRQNAENIRRNAEAIRRQTEALEKIRDHYYPRKTLWKRLSSSFLKLVGAVTLVAGVMEAVEWYVESRIVSSMADESSAVADRLFNRENDMDGAIKFLEKAVELHGGSAKYRMRLAYVKGLKTLSELLDLERPLTADERARVDAILAEAVFLQEVEPKAAMPLVLAAQAYGLRGERKLAVETAERAVALDGECVQAHITACAQNFFAGNVPAARQHLAEAGRIGPDFPLTMFWQGFFALVLDRDPSAAKAHIARLLERSPKSALSHLLMGRILMAGEKPNLAAVRESLALSLAADPALVAAMTLTAATFERENRLTLARLWLDRALAQDPNNMKALLASARLNVREKDFPAADVNLSAAIALAPFRADLYLERAKVRSFAGDAAGAAKDRQYASDLQSLGR